MAHTYSKRGASTSSAVGGKTNGGDSAATSKEEDYSPNHVVYKKVTFTPVDYYNRARLNNCRAV